MPLIGNTFRASTVLGQVGYSSFGIFAKYSPFSMFQDGKGPEVQMASIGLKLNF